jgi:gamma-glutamyltranspeptidase/glutathione hydrolase
VALFPHENRCDNDKRRHIKEQSALVNASTSPLGRAMPQQIIANKVAVAAGHPLGAEAGLEMLRDGGNAIDAAVATMLALCVVIPGSVGIGGYGGSAVIRRCGRSPDGCGRSPDRATELTEGLKNRHGGDLRSGHVRGRETRAQLSIVAVDFDSRAPLAFRDGVVTADPQSSYYGARSVTVPGVVAGLDLILSDFGTMSWRQVSQPAIRLAHHGFEFDFEHQRHFDRCAPKFDQATLGSYFPAGAATTIGDRWRQPDLARLLEQLAEDGPGIFYEGEIARRIVWFLRDRDGLLTEEDFHSYRPQFVEPIQSSFRGYDLLTPPPPSGGITSLGIVQTVEKLLSATRIEPWGAEYFHTLAEATKLCWRERDRTLGDPDFVSIPMEQLISEQAAAARAELISKLGHGILPPSPQPPTPSPSHTANVIATDAEGNLISLTATQGWMYGSHLVVDGLGLLLNHGMSRFDYVPGHPNAPAPGKRMQHNMSPMVALREDQPAFAFGLPGGPKIVNVTAQLAHDTIAFGAAPAAAIDAPRLHTVGDEPLAVSQHMPDPVVAELEKFGHTVRREDDLGGPVNVLAIDPQTRKIDIASGEGTGAVAGI